MLPALTFYLFAAILLASALKVISARNPVHSVLFLILAFFNAAGLFVLLGAEFVAMILVIVYVGAVAVLFLFVVMMLDISFADLRQGAMQYVPLGFLIGMVLLVELVMLYAGWYSAAPDLRTGLGMATPDADQVQNTRALGQVLYTHYMLPFQVAGMILLVSMIGAIVLTHRQRDGVRRQKVSDQVARRAANVIELRTVKTGEGV